MSFDEIINLTADVFMCFFRCMMFLSSYFLAAGVTQIYYITS